MKSIIISKEVHDKLKEYCQNKNHKLGGFVEKLIVNFLNEVK